MKFSIIIPNLNGAKYLETCLPALLKSLKNFTSEIILVDNGSTDNSIELTQKIFKNAVIIRNINNNGFAPAINQGIYKSKYDWVVLLNNDLNIDPDWFNLVSKNMSDIYAVYSGTVLTKDGSKYESTGLNFDYRGRCQNIKNGAPYLQSNIYDLTPTPIWGASAALAVYNKNILEHIGGYDSDFFAYEEDVDVCLRLHLLGYKTLYVPGAISYHLGGGTSSKMNNFRNIMDTKNWFYIIIKDYPLSIIKKYFWSIFIERLSNLSGLIKTTIKIYKIKSLYYLPLALLKSYGEVIIYLPKMFKKRHQFQKQL